MQVLETMQPSEIKLSNGTSLDQIVFIGKCIYTEHICIMCIYVCNDVRTYIYIYSGFFISILISGGKIWKIYLINMDIPWDAHGI